MTKVRSGLLLIGVGVFLNLLGRLLIYTAGQQQSLILAGTLFILMLLSVAIGIFGLVRLIAGLITKS